jgi:hypothetical protein
MSIINALQRLLPSSQFDKPHQPVGRLGDDFSNLAKVVAGIAIAIFAGILIGPVPVIAFVAVLLVGAAFYFGINCIDCGSSSSSSHWPWSTTHYSGSYSGSGNYGSSYTSSSGRGSGNGVFTNSGNKMVGSRTH